MKIIHICGPSAVGKNYLLNQLARIVKKNTRDMADSEKLLLSRFGVTGKCGFPGPVSHKWDRELSDLEKDLNNLVEDGGYDTILHRWQPRSSKLISFASKVLPDYEQKTFIIWLDPIRHQQQALTFRTGDDYKDWSYYRLKEFFRKCVKDVFLHVKQSYDNCDIESQQQVKLADIPSQLDKYNIEVVTPISLHPLSLMYATVDADNLSLILSPD